MFESIVRDSLCWATYPLFGGLLFTWNEHRARRLYLSAEQTTLLKKEQFIFAELRNIEMIETSLIIEYRMIGLTEILMTCFQ